MATGYFNFKVLIQCFNVYPPSLSRIVFSTFFFFFLSSFFPPLSSIRVFLQFRETYFRSCKSLRERFSPVQMKKQRSACDKQEEGEIGKAILVTAF